MAWEPGKIRFFAEKTTAPTVNDDKNDGYRESDIWIDETNDKAYVCLDAAAGSAVWTEITGAGSGIAEALFDANTILKADLNDTPEALTIAEQRIVGRITAGVITALTPAQVRTLLNIADGATVDQDKAAIDGLGISHDALSDVSVDDHHAQAHKADHVNGTDDIRDATNSQKGLATAAQITALEANVNKALNDLINVTILSADPDDVLKFDGSAWVNGPGPGGVSGSAGISFYPDLTEILPKDTENLYEVASLLKIPSGVGEEVDTIVCNNNTVMNHAFLYDTGLGTTKIEAGTWRFDSYASVGSIIGGRVSTLTRVIYCVVVEDSITIEITGSGTSRTATASGGSIFASEDANGDLTVCGFVQTPKGLYQITGYTSPTVVTIATPTLYENESGVAFNTWKNKFSATSAPITAQNEDYVLTTSATVQPAVTIAAIDKLGLIIFATSNDTTEVYFVHNGTEHYSYFTSPMLTRHNDLVGLNVLDYQHITVLQKAALHAQDTDTALGGLGTKDPPIDADKVIHRNSEDSDALVTSTWTQIKAFFKTYFDGIYADAGANSDITSMTGLSDKGIPEAKVIHTRVVVVKCIADDTALAVANGVAHFTIPIELNGMNLVSVGAHVYTPSSSGLPTFMVYNLTDSSNMLSTAITIDETEKDSKDADTLAVIDTGEDDVVTGDELRFDCTTAGTDTTGMEIRLGFRLP